MRAHAVFACLVTSLLVTRAPTPALAQDAAGFAQQRFDAGLARFESADPAGALAEFRASHALYASPNSRLYIARSLRELGRLAEAVTEFELTLAEANDRARTDARYAETAAAAQAELTALEPRVGRLAVRVVATPPAPEGAARLVVGEREVPAAAHGLALPVEPGRVAVVAQAPGYVPVRREVQVGPGAHEQLTVELVVAAPTNTLANRAPARRTARLTGLHTAAIASTAVTAAALIVFAATAGLAAADYAGLRDRCGDLTPCPASEQATIEQGRALQTTANVALGVTLVGAAAAVTFWALALRPARRTEVRVGLGAVAIAGAF